MPPKKQIDLSPEIATDVAIEQAARWTRFFHDRVGQPRVGGDIPSEQLMYAVHELVKSPECRKSGEFLSTILRMPLPWQNTIMEYIQQVKPYERLGFDAEITLRNEGSRSVSITTAAKRIPFRNPQTGVALKDAWNTLPVHRVLAGGDTITVHAHFATLALRRYSWAASQPHFWELRGKGGAEKPLREIAYSVRYLDSDTGETVTVQSGAVQEHVDQPVQQMEMGG
jgi:hypothetical protein